MKKHLEIIKSLGMSLLLFLLLSAAAISEDSCEITVTIAQSSSSAGSTESKIVITTYDSEGGLIETTEAFGDDSTTTEGSDPEDNSNNGDTISAENIDSGDMTDSQPDELVLEENTDEWFESILAMLDEEELLSTIDLMQDSADTANVE